MKRLLAALTATLALAPATPAMAADGLGLAGHVDDKTVTFFCFGVMIFFTVLVIVLSYFQARLEGRKERIQAEIERLRQP